MRPLGSELCRCRPEPQHLNGPRSGGASGICEEEAMEAGQGWSVGRRTREVRLWLVVRTVAAPGEDAQTLRLFRRGSTQNSVPC